MEHIINLLNGINRVSEDLVSLCNECDVNLDHIYEKLSEREQLIQALQRTTKQVTLQKANLAEVEHKEKLLELKLAFSKLNGIIMHHLHGLLNSCSQELEPIPIQRKAIQSYRFQL